MNTILKRFFQVFLIVCFVGAAGVVIWLLAETKPEAQEKVQEEEAPLVEVVAVELGSHRLDVPSQGMVQAKKRTTLAAELSGKVVEVSDQFVSGGVFGKGDTLMKIESADYNAILAEAQSVLEEAKVALETEEARAEQAKRDWERLGRGKASPLTLREPQIRSAKARISAAESAVKKAQRDVERTVIKAPFNSTVVAKLTEVGNFVAPGTPVAELFQTSPLEIRLPLALDELQFIDSTKSGELKGDVTLFTKVGNQEIRWKGQIKRSEGEVDRQTRSIHVVVDITPDEKPGTILKLQPGLFVQATITGKNFKGLAKVPASAFLDLDRVALVENGRLDFKKVTVLRREGDFVFVSEGLKEGEILCLTELSAMIEGTEVQTKEAGEETPLIRP